MVTVFCADQKQITLPHSVGHEEGRWEGLRDGGNHQVQIVKFDKNRRAEVDEYTAELLCRLYPNSCFREETPTPEKKKSK